MDLIFGFEKNPKIGIGFQVLFEGLGLLTIGFDKKIRIFKIQVIQSVSM